MSATDARAYFDARHKLDAGTGCWQWTGNVGGNAYGRSCAAKARMYAHRLSYELHVGPIPADMTIDHLCFNKLCVNPAHLSLKTRVENAKRQRSAMRTHCKSGHEFTPENTLPRPAGEGQRECRACGRIRAAAYQRRRRNELRAAA